MSRAYAHLGHAHAQHVVGERLLRGAGVDKVAARSVATPWAGKRRQAAETFSHFWGDSLIAILANLRASKIYCIK